jgi:Cys-tRNA(Pro) deacylase
VGEHEATGGRRGSGERVRSFLAAHGLDGGIHTFSESTKTAQMAADAMGCELGQIVKTLVFSVDGRVALALVAGDRRGDGRAIADELGGTKAKLADAETVRDATGYAIGGVSPFDLAEGLPVLVDDSLARFEIVYPAAGTPDSMVQMDLDAMLDITGGQMARISTRTDS